MIQILMPKLIMENNLVLFRFDLCRLNEGTCNTCKIYDKVPSHHEGTRMRDNDWCGWYLNELKGYNK